MITASMAANSMNVDANHYASEFRLSDMVVASEPVGSQLSTVGELLAAVRERHAAETRSLLARCDQSVRRRRADVDQQRHSLLAARARRAQLDVQGATHRKEEEAREEALGACERDLETVRRATDVAMREREHIATKLSDLRQENREEGMRLQEQESAIEVTKQTLQRAGEHCRQRLGMELRKVSGQRLQLVMTCIDYEEPDQPFTFCVKIGQGDRAYCVDTCEPKVPDLDALVEKLNTTNDFRSFVITMRQQFKATLR